MNRRDFLQLGGTCAAHLGLFGGGRVSALAQSTSGSTHRVVLEQPWARFEQIVDGVWAIVSTPLGGGENAMRTTGCGTGIFPTTSMRRDQPLSAGAWRYEMPPVAVGHPGR
jgi:hypothetical protein